MTAEFMWRLSASLFTGLCQIVGTPEEVSIRRAVADVEDMLHDKLSIFTNLRFMRAGSSREGLRLNGSDVDIMFWSIKARLVLNMPLSNEIKSGEEKFLLKFSETHPGFAYIKVIADKTYTTGLNAKVTHCNINNDKGRYLNNVSIYGIDIPFIEDNGPHIHGPCISFSSGNKDVDMGFSFKCDEWPTPALPLKNRSESHHWPSSPLLEDIINDGCHVVGIGRKGSGNEANQWRISFSSAEQKLIYSFNHCQFLCYGLLKLFLKEVLNKDVENPLLCSYFLKTALFWEIQAGNVNV